MTESAQRPDGPPPPEQQLMRMIMGKFVSRSLTVAADLGIADILQEGSRSAEEFATATETHADGLYRVLRALTATIGRPAWRTPSSGTSRSSEPVFERGAQEGKRPRRSSRATS